MNRGLRRRTLVGTGLAAGVGISGGAYAVGPAVKVGFVHPVTGALSASGALCRAGARYAVEDWNAKGGFSSMEGALVEPIWSDTQSRPDQVAGEVDRIHEAGACAALGAFSSALSVVMAQAAARHGLPHAVDIGTADSVLQQGQGFSFRFGPAFSSFVDFGLDNLATINNDAGKPCRTVMLVHEDSLFGTSTAKLLAERLPGKGFEVVGVLPHATPTRDFTNIALRIRQAKPDVLIPSSYYNEDALLLTTLRQQRVEPKAIYHILGGAASSYRFVQSNRVAANYIMDTTDWFDPSKPSAMTLKARAEKDGLAFTYEVFLIYATTMFLFDAIERAGSPDRSKIVQSLASSTWSGHFMPYGPTKMVGGQNTGAQPVNTQILDGDVKLVFPKAFASAMPVFPTPSNG